MPTLIRGAAGSGKTTALVRQYADWVKAGARTDEILVLTAAGAHASRWRAGLPLEAHGPVEAFSFYGFLQREIILFWAPLQAAVPALCRWIRPEFLSADVSRRMIQGLLEPLEVELAGVVKAQPDRLARQVAGGLGTVAAAAGLTASEAAERLAGADRGEKAGIYERVRQVLEAYREDCLRAGLLDYGLALDLFSTVLVKHMPYTENLRARYRYLLVDDLDETVPAEQVFLAALAGQVEQAVVAFGDDGGQTAFLGADPEGAVRRFGSSETVELAGSHTCSAETFALSDALSERIMGRFPSTPPGSGQLITGHIATDLRPEMLNQVLAAVAGLLGQGVPAGEVAIITPAPDAALEVLARQALGEHALLSLTPTRRLIDDPVVRAAVAIAGLVQPGWRIFSDGSGILADALQVALGADRAQAALLADAVRQAGGVLPDLAAAGLLERLSPPALRQYGKLHHWVEEARTRTWQPDELAQAILVGAVASGPWAGTNLTPARLNASRRLLEALHQSRTALERLEAEGFGYRYIRLLSEAAGGAVLPPTLPFTTDPAPPSGEAPAAPAVILATPLAYLSARLTSRVQVWVDISSDAWYPNDVKELSNPHVLAPAWTGGEVWTDRHSRAARQQAAARMARALLRHCRGQIWLAECSLNAWGQEQNGGLAEAFADVAGPLRERGPGGT